MNELTYVIISHSFLKITVVLRAKISAFEVENVIGPTEAMPKLC